MSARLHKIKRFAGLRGDDAIAICLDDGEVYDTLTEDPIGSLYDPQVEKTVNTMRHNPMATLRFVADDLAPASVTEILAIEPAMAAAKGDSVGQRRTVRAGTGTWFVTTERAGLGGSPADHLGWVVKLAKGKLAALRQRFPGIRAELSLLVHGTEFEVSDLPRLLLKRAVAIGELEIEVPARGIDVFLNAETLARHLQNETPA